MEQEKLTRLLTQAKAAEDEAVALLADAGAQLKRATALRTSLDALLAELSATQSPQEGPLVAQDYPGLLRPSEAVPQVIDFTGQLSVDK